VTITKEEGEKLGMHIKGGTGSTKQGNPLDASDQGVFVSKINSSGAASRQGGLQVTDKSLNSHIPILVVGQVELFSRPKQF
jgi:PDZ domain